MITDSPQCSAPSMRPHHDSPHDRFQQSVTRMLHGPRHRKMCHSPEIIKITQALGVKCVNCMYSLSVELKTWMLILETFPIKMEMSWTMQPSWPTYNCSDMYNTRIHVELRLDDGIRANIYCACLVFRDIHIACEKRRTVCNKRMTCWWVSRLII